MDSHRSFDIQALFRPCRGRLAASRRTVTALLLCAAGAAFALGIAGTARAADTQAAANGATAPGAWQSHRLTFNYLGISPVYSCNGLKSTLTYLLRQSGARLNAPIYPRPCASGFGQPERLLQARLDFSTLAPGAGGSGQQAVEGRWHKVLFSPTHSHPELMGGDCELVQEFMDKILPAFHTRNVRSNLNCVPHQTTGYFFALSFEVFAPANAAPRTIGGG